MVKMAPIREAQDPRGSLPPGTRGSRSPRLIHEPMRVHVTTAVSVNTERRGIGSGSRIPQSRVLRVERGFWVFAEPRTGALRQVFTAFGSGYATHHLSAFHAVHTIPQVAMEESEGNARSYS